MAGNKIVKLGEREARILALQIAATFPAHEATTTQIKKAAPKFREWSEADLKPSDTRSKECMWQQILGNAVGSHQNSQSEHICQGICRQNSVRCSGHGEGLADAKKFRTLRVESLITWLEPMQIGSTRCIFVPYKPSVCCSSSSTLFYASRIKRNSLTKNPNARWRALRKDCSRSFGTLQERKTK